MNKLRHAATRFINAVFISIAAGFAGAMAIYLVLAAYTWTFTDDSPARYAGRAVGCLVLALGFKFLATLDDYEIAPAGRTTRRRHARKA